MCPFGGKLLSPSYPMLLGIHEKKVTSEARFPRNANTSSFWLSEISLQCDHLLKKEASQNSQMRLLAPILPSYSHWRTDQQRERTPHKETAYVPRDVHVRNPNPEKIWISSHFGIHLPPPFPRPLSTNPLESRPDWAAQQLERHSPARPQRPWSYSHSAHPAWAVGAQCKSGAWATSPWWPMFLCAS